MKSIRRYLVILLLSSICLANFLAALKGYEGGIAAGDAILDKELEDESRLLANLISQGIELPNQYIEENYLYHVISPRAEENSYPTELRFDEIDRAPGFHWFSYGGERWRVLTKELSNHGVLIVGRRDARYRMIIETMVVESILPIIWVLPLLGIIIWAIVSYGLSPVRRLARLLQLRSAGNLQPLALDGFPKELTVVVSAINVLMQRLEDAFTREQRFTSDAAHELRTPLTAIKLHLHNLRQELQSNNANLDATEQAVNRMANSIEQMLALYRITPEKFYRERKPIEFDLLVKQVIVDLYPTLENKSQQIELDAVEVNLQGDFFALQTLVKNVIDNAIKYAPQSGQVHVAVSVSGKSAHFIVEDSGPGIPVEERQRAFERFHRIGGDRHQSKVVGSGLGLAIVKHIVDLHKGSIELTESDKLGGLRVAVSFPLDEK